MAEPTHRMALAKAVQYLGKREGLDKLLKLIQYTTKLVVSVSKDEEGIEILKNLKVFASNVGQSRKAFRLGKFLGYLEKLLSQDAPMDSTLGMLERLANGSSCVYYFLEQLVWLCKAGMIKDKDLEWRLGSASVRAEMLSYMANIAASLLKLSALLEHERLLESEFRRREKDGAETGMCAPPSEIRALRSRRRLLLMDILQDSLDALIALNDIRGGTGRLSGHPTVLAMAGLASAAISANKNWPN